MCTLYSTIVLKEKAITTRKERKQKICEKNTNKIACCTHFRKDVSGVNDCWNH